MPMDVIIWSLIHREDASRSVQYAGQGQGEGAHWPGQVHILISNNWAQFYEVQ